MYSKNKMNIEIEMLFGQESILIKKGTALRLIGLSGFAAPTNELKTEEFAKDGGSIEGRRYGMREMSIRFGISELPHTEEIRHEIIRKMQSDKGCTLIVKRGDRIGTIECGVAGEPTITQTNYIRDRAVIEIPLLAPSPFFKSTYPKTFALTQGDNALLNAGDAPAGWTANIRITQAAQDIRLGMGDEEILLRGDFAAGDEIGIVSEEHERRVLKNGEDYFRYDIASTFFAIPTGDSSLNLSCGTGTAEGELVTYERYLGI